MLEIGTFIAALGAFVATGVYAWITHKTYVEVQQQTALMRQQLPELQKSTKAAQDSASLTRHSVVGTDAAILEATATYQPSTDQPSPPNPVPLFTINIRNTGKSIASEVKGTFVISRKTLPAMKTLDSHTVTLEFGQIANLGPSSMGKDKIFQVPGFNLKAVLQRRETVTVEGKYTYNDGFDDTITGSICSQLQAILNSAICDYQGAAFMGCEYVPFDNARLQRMEQNCKEQQNSNQKH